MRIIGVLSAVLIVLATIGIALAHEIGHRRRVDTVPIPAADGCWQGACFFDMAESNIPLALGTHPDVAKFNGVGVVSRYFFDVAHSIAPEQRPTTGVVLSFAAPEWYVMAWDWSVLHNPALMRAGDAILALGPPDWVSISPNGTECHYVDRHLVIVVDPVHFRGNMAHVMPDSAVTYFMVANPRLLDETWTDSSLGVAWHGFGTYIFED